MLKQHLLLPYADNV